MVRHPDRSTVGSTSRLVRFNPGRKGGALSEDTKKTQRWILATFGIAAGILVILFLEHSSALYVGGIIIASSVAYGTKGTW
jgi:hypothetical protein